MLKSPFRGCSIKYMYVCMWIVFIVLLHFLKEMERPFSAGPSSYFRVGQLVSFLMYAEDTLYGLPYSFEEAAVLPCSVQLAPYEDIH